MMSFREWKKAIEGCLLEMADLDYQKKIWVEGRGPEVGSFVELICTLYDDYDFKGFLEYLQKNNYDTKLLIKLEDLNKKLRSFLDSEKSDAEDTEIINDPVWQDIARCAVEGLVLLKAIA